MKLKYFFFFSLCLLTTYISAQKVNKDTISLKQPLIYRAEIGYSQITRYGTQVSNTPYRVIRLGGNVEFPLKYNFGIETGLNYNYSFGDKTQYLGNKISDGSDDYSDYDALDTINYSYKNHSLNIPLHITYTLPVFWGLKLFGYAGPSFRIGLKEPVKVESAKNLYAQDEEYDAYTNKLNRFDIQLGVGGGIQWKSYRVKSGYDWGILNASKENNSSQHNRGWLISFEYEF